MTEREAAIRRAVIAENELARYTERQQQRMKRQYSVEYTEYQWKRHDDLLTAEFDARSAIPPADPNDPQDRELEYQLRRKWIGPERQESLF